MVNQKAREETIRYHESYYSSHKLFQEGWLQEPDEEISRIVSLMSGLSGARLLDIGCGVGRNSIALARDLKRNGVVVDCCDMIASAIDLLKAYAAEFGVTENIVARVVDMDALQVERESYDAILAISVLEHSHSVEGVERLLSEIGLGVKPGGLVRITISTDRRVTACDTGDSVETRVETPLCGEQVVEMLERHFCEWTVDRLSLVPYKEDLIYQERLVTWTCTDVSFLARKPKLKF